MKIRIDAEALETGQTQGQVCELYLRRSFERDAEDNAERRRIAEPSTNE